MTNNDDNMASDGQPSEAVLDELSAVFAEPERPSYNFDDPSIDRMLGIDPASLPDDDIDEAVFDDEAYDVDPDDDEPADDEPETPSPRPTIVIDDDGVHEVVHTTLHTVFDDAPRSTVVIGDDDQPDTVYLDSEADDRLRDVHGDTIVIDDLDDGVVPAQADPVDEDAPRGSLDPRIRARRIAARRAEGRKRLKWAAIIGGAVVVVVGTLAVVASPLFKATDVRVQGAVYTDRDVLAAVITDLQSTPILLVDTKAEERRLERVPWVETARVATSFPHTVVIDIRERRPLATFRAGDGKWRVIDVEGRVLDVIAGQPVAYMLVTGTHPDTGRGDYAGAPYATVGRLVAALPPEIRSRTTSISLDSSTSNLSLVLNRGDKHSIVVHLGDGSALEDKLARLLNQIHTGLDRVVEIDVSTEEVGVVRG